MTSPSRTPGRLTGVLLLVASAVLGASTLPGAPAAVETAGLAAIGTAVAATVTLHFRSRRLGWAVVCFVLLAIGDRLADHAVGVGQPWAVCMTFGGYLIWSSALATPRALVRALAPSLVAAVAGLALHGDGADVMIGAAPLLPLAAVAALLAAPVQAGRRASDRLARNLADLDAVVLANVELRHVGEGADAARRTARIASELLDADGATVWVRGPGRLLCAGGHGSTPPPEVDTVPGDAVDAVLATGSVQVDGDDVVLPLTASGGVFGAVVVSNARRGKEAFLASILQVFGAHAGYTLERLRAVEGLIDARYVDPVTGVGNRMAATASLATLQPGDAVLLLALDELDEIRAREGDDRADLMLGHLGLHLRTGTRAGDLVARFGDDVFFILLRDLTSSAEAVVTRLLQSWQETRTAGRLRAGAALHFADSTPLDTLDRATEALEAGSPHRDPIHAAAERAVWGPASAA